MNYILFDDQAWQTLLPLTFTRPVADLRIGIMTIAEKWNKYLNTTCSFLTQAYLQPKYPLKTEATNVLINGSFLPTPALIKAIEHLNMGQALMKDRMVIAVKLSEVQTKAFNVEQAETLSIVQFTDDVLAVRYPYHIFKHNGQALTADFELITAGRRSQPLSATNRVRCPENIFIEEGAEVEFATLNAQDSYIYIGKNALVMENSVIRGSFALCDHAVVKLAAKIYGPTTIGPYSKVGGEINNSVLWGYSNKGHDGFLGNSVLGQWCNLGADTNNSNLKNNYDQIKLWDYSCKRFTPTGLQFCGLIMGDHSKSGINTMFNTGTVVGVSANIYGGGFPRNFIPSFSWGGALGFTTYAPKKAFATAQRVMERRQQVLDEIEEGILQHIFDQTKAYRK